MVWTGFSVNFGLRPALLHHRGFPVFAGRQDLVLRAADLRLHDFEHCGEALRRAARARRVYPAGPASSREADPRLALAAARGRAAAFTRIVKQQPEYRLKEIQQRDSILRLIQDNLPRHIQPLVQDFQTVNELVALARESAAFLVGHATGRKAARLHTDNRGRVRNGTRANRVPLRLGDGTSKPSR